MRYTHSKVTPCRRTFARGNLYGLRWLCCKGERNRHCLMKQSLFLAAMNQPIPPEYPPLPFDLQALSTAIFTAEWTQFLRLPIYAYVAVTAAGIVGQLRYLNAALHHFDAMSIVPVYQGAIVISNSLAGVVYYRDLREESPERKFAFAVGALATIGGVNILQLKAKAAASYSKDAMDAGDTPRDPAAKEASGAGRLVDVESIAASISIDDIIPKR